MQIKKLKQADTVATFLETGDLKELNSCGMMINQLEAQSFRRQYEPTLFADNYRGHN